MPFSPISNWVSLAFLAFVAVAMFFNPDTRVALYIAPIWFGLIAASYYAAGMHKGNGEKKSLQQ